ncbi:hypothetical protein O3Q51_15340 [Cryomorphaceae bacterium 1068]|nr:hypothetical protein [Cryomorphaceae bacterium 1068]
MRLAVLHIIFLFGFGSAFGQSSKTIRTYGIEKKTETLIIYNNGIEVARYTEEVEMYNSEGDWVEKLTYSSGGELKLHQKRTYDGDDVIDETTIDLNGSGIKNAKPPSFERIQYVYEKGEVVLEKKLSQNGEVLEQKESVYNKLGDLIEVTTKDGKGSVLKRETTEYDNRGLKIKESITDSSGAILKEKIFVYE